MKQTTLGIFVFVSLIIVTPTLVYAQQQQQNPPSPPILAALIQKDDSMSFGNDSRYYIQAPAKIDLSRFEGGQIYSITSDDQTWISIFEDGAIIITGMPFYKKIDNQTHISTEIVHFSGISGFNRVDYDKTTGLTTYSIKPGTFSIGDISLLNVQFFVQTLQNGTGVLNIY